MKPDHGNRASVTGEASGIRPTRNPVLLTPASLAIAAFALAVADWGSRMAGDSFIPGGPIDELAHLLTAVLMLWALGRRASERFLLPAMIASVAIDLDHVPGRLGEQWLTSGTPRPYTHSSLTIAAVLAVGLLLRGRRNIFFGVALGLAIHFFRDLSEPRSGVSLLWPWSNRSFSIPHASYVGVIAVVILVDAVRLSAQLWSRSGPGRVPARERAFVNGDASAAPR